MFKRSVIVSAAAIVLAGLFGLRSAQAIVVFSNFAAPDNGVSFDLNILEYEGEGFIVPAGNDYILNSVSAYLRAPEVTQEVIFEVWSGAGSGGPGTRPDTYYATIGSVDVPSGMDFEMFTVYAGTTIVLSGGINYFVVARASGYAEWQLSNTAPTGIFTDISEVLSNDGGTTWVWEEIDHVRIEIDADIYTPPDDDDDVVIAAPVPGCDLAMAMPANSVVGTFVADARLHWSPGAAIEPALTLEAGKSVWVLGLDASGMYYKIILACDYLWVPVGTIGPNYDAVWNGTPLPTTVVE